VAVCSSFRPFNAAAHLRQPSAQVIDDEYEYSLTRKEVPLRG
jgi:hypothetical protein